MPISSADLIKRCDITYRQLDYWIREGYVEPLGEPTPGSGNRREFSESEAAFVGTLSQLAKTGMRIEIAAGLALDLWVNGTAHLGPFTITEERHDTHLQHAGSIAEPA